MLVLLLTVTTVLLTVTQAQLCVLTTSCFGCGTSSIDCMSKGLSDFPTLIAFDQRIAKDLDLSFNSISEVAENDLAGYTILERLRLQGNPWNCDCKLRWLVTFPVIEDQPTCASPSTLAGEEIASLSPEQLICECVPACVGGTCDTSIGVCMCDDGFTGVDCSECLPACVRGTCDTSTGVCMCDEGFTGVDCSSVDECFLGLDNCHRNADCIDTDESFQCRCKDGYRGNGRTCTDINECARGTDRCHFRATCTNTVGSYTCTCEHGFEDRGSRRRPGRLCFDANECSDGDACDSNALCFNTYGSYRCICRPGFTGNGHSCELSSPSIAIPLEGTDGVESDDTVSSQSSSRSGGRGRQSSSESFTKSSSRSSKRSNKGRG